MLEAIKQLLVLQDTDQKIIRLQAELADLGPQRLSMQSQAGTAQAAFETVRNQYKLVENERKKSELEVETQKELIAKYSLQQFQTKKNEEYRAFSQQIETCKERIRAQEDIQLELMEKAEGIQKKVQAASVVAQDAQATVKSKLGDMEQRQHVLEKQLSELQVHRNQLVAQVPESVRMRYERLLQHRGGKVVVGIAHSVCAGCHMKLPPQIIVSCQGAADIINCPNCGRLLFHSPDMDLTPID